MSEIENETISRLRNDVELFKNQLATECNLERNAKFERAFQLAWSYGHSCGMEEVKIHFQELVDLLKPQPTMYYSYSPEEGIQFHDTADQAKSRAEQAIEAACDVVADGFAWADNEHEICWGSVTEITAVTDRSPTGAEKADNPDVDVIRKLCLEPVRD